MANLKLTNQKADSEKIKAKTADLKTQLDLRKDIWAKCSLEKKKQWVKSDKDPIMTLAYQMYEYLHDNFFDGVK